MTLLTEVRALIAAGTAEYTAGGVTYWTDAQLQEALDHNRTMVTGIPIDWHHTPIIGGSGSVAYTTGTLAAGGVVQSGTITAGTGTPGTVMTTAGSVPAGTVVFTTDGEVSFTTDQGGTAYGFYGYTYDLYAAAADVLEQWASALKLGYDFRTDDQEFKRSQMVDIIAGRARSMRARQLPGSTRLLTLDADPCVPDRSGRRSRRGSV